MTGLRLSLYHPGVANLPCAQCAKMQHNMETGEPLVGYAGPNKTKPFNYPLTKPPCKAANPFTCPKGSPEQESEVTLSEKNRRTVLLYLQAKATGFHYVPEFDALLADNFSIVQSVYAGWEREQANNSASKTATSAALSLVAAMRGG